MATNGGGDATAVAAAGTPAETVTDSASVAISEPPPTNEEGVSEAEVSLMRKILRTKLIQSKNNVEIMRSDPNSPLYSIKSFEELHL